MSRPLLLSLLLFLGCVGLYLPTLPYPFIYDSKAQILTDPFLHDFGNLKAILTLEVMGQDRLDFNRPGVLLSLMGDAFLWGKNPAGYRFTSILLHAGVALLLFRVLLRLLGSPLAAFFSAALFALHPLNVETVVEVSYREDLLVAFFILAALLLATLLRPGSQSPARQGMLAAGILASLFLAAASKETGIAGPPLLLAYILLYRRSEPCRNRWLLLSAAAFLLCGAFYAARFLLAPETSIIFTEKPRPIAPEFLQRLAIQTRIWTAEWLRIFWPLHLSPAYSGTAIRNIPLWLGISVVTLALLLQGWLSFRSRLFALGALLFWLALLPVSNFIPIYQPMADRFLYLPLVGFAFMLAPLLAWLKRFPARLRQAVGIPAAVALLLALALLTFRQERLWSSPLTLWKAAREQDPFSFVPNLGVAWAYLELNQPREAYQPFLQAIRASRERYYLPFLGLALGLQAEGRLPEAVTLYRKAVELDPRVASPDALSKALVLEDRFLAELHRLQAEAQSRP